MIFSSRYQPKRKIRPNGAMVRQILEFDLQLVTKTIPALREYPFN
jgi:hypothetical protein